MSVFELIVLHVCFLGVIFLALIICGTLTIYFREMQPPRFRAWPHNSSDVKLSFGMEPSSPPDTSLAHAIVPDLPGRTQPPNTFWRTISFQPD